MGVTNQAIVLCYIMQTTFQLIPILLSLLFISVFVARFVLVQARKKVKTISNKFSFILIAILWILTILLVLVIRSQFVKFGDCHDPKAEVWKFSNDYHSWSWLFFLRSSRSSDSYIWQFSLSRFWLCLSSSLSKSDKSQTQSTLLMPNLTRCTINLVWRFQELKVRATMTTRAKESSSTLLESWRCCSYYFGCLSLFHQQFTTQKRTQCRRAFPCYYIW